MEYNLKLHLDFKFRIKTDLDEAARKETEDLYLLNINRGRDFKRFNTMWNQGVAWFQIVPPESVNIKVYADRPPYREEIIKNVFLRWLDYKNIKYYLCPNLDNLNNMDPPISEQIIDKFRDKKIIINRRGQYFPATDLRYGIINNYEFIKTIHRQILFVRDKADDYMLASGKYDEIRKMFSKTI